MDVDRRELVRRLFALATEIAEAAHEVSVTGQASTLSTHELAEAARALHRHAGDLKVIAATIAVASVDDALGPPIADSS